MSITELQQTARASGSEAGRSVGQGPQRAGVEADDRVAEVVVVEQDQVGLSAPASCGSSVRAPATSASWRWVRVSASSAAAYRPTGQVVRAQRRVLRRRLLQDGERGEGAVGVDREIGLAGCSGRRTPARPATSSARLTPELGSSAASRSARVALPQAWRRDRP